MVSSGECVTNELGDDKLQERKAPEGEIHAEQPISHNELDAPRTGQEHAAAAEDPRKAPVLDVVVYSMDKDNGGGNISRESEKTPKAADVRPIASFGPEANAYAIPEKVPEDGYNWRKYGQKLVKGNEFVRSYYKCTHLNCHVKKQLERSHDGRITDTVYFGEHDHPKPLDHGLVEKEKSSNAQSHTPRQNRVALTSQPLPATPAEDFKAPPQSNKSSSEVVGTADDPSSKRRKKENNNVDVTPVEKPSNDMRTVVRTLSDVDLVNDGYRWRKYGQKLVKGSPHPRSYYRCSSPGCPVKKHVERASHDDKMVITTYEGHHDHDLPPARTVTPNISSPNFHTTVQKEGTGTRSEGNDSVLHKVASHSGSYPHSENKSELLNGESRAKLEPSRHDVEEVNTAASVPVRRSSEGEGVKSEINKA